MSYILRVLLSLILTLPFVVVFTMFSQALLQEIPPWYFSMSLGGVSFSIAYTMVSSWEDWR